MRALFAIVLGTLLASPAFAQPPQKQNEVFLGIGDPGLVWGFHEVGSELLDALFDGGNVTYGDMQGGFQIAVGYQRWLRAWSSAGVTASWTGSSKTVFIDGEDRGEDQVRILTLMAEWRVHWLRNPSVDLYSGLGGGVFQLRHKVVTFSIAGQEAKIWPAVQLIPLGVRAGRDWGGFFELLIGTNGLLKAGLSRRL